MVARFTHNASVSSFFLLQNVGNARFVPHVTTKLVFPQKILKLYQCRSDTREGISQTNRDSTKLFLTFYWHTVTVLGSSTANSSHCTVRTCFFSRTNYTTKIAQHKTVDSKVPFSFRSNQFRYYTMKL